MAAKSRSVKKWVVAVTAAGGVAAGVVNAAGAASSDALPPHSANSAEVQQLDRQVAELTQQEQNLESSLRSHRAQAAAGASPETTVSGVVTSEPAHPSGDSQGRSVPSSSIPDSQGGQPAVGSSRGESQPTSTTGPPDPTPTSGPPVTSTTLTPANPSNDGSDDAGGTTSTTGAQHDG